MAHRTRNRASRRDRAATAASATGSPSHHQHATMIAAVKVNRLTGFSHPKSGRADCIAITSARADTLRHFNQGRARVLDKATGLAISASQRSFGASRKSDPFGVQIARHALRETTATSNNRSGHVLPSCVSASPAVLAALALLLPCRLWPKAAIAKSSRQAARGPAGGSAKEAQRQVDEFAEASRLMTGPAGNPECVWLGRRVVGLCGGTTWTPPSVISTSMTGSAAPARISRPPSAAWCGRATISTRKPPTASTPGSIPAGSTRPQRQRRRRRGGRGSRAGSCDPAQTARRRRGRTAAKNRVHARR